MGVRVLLGSLPPLPETADADSIRRLGEGMGRKEDLSAAIEAIGTRSMPLDEALAPSSGVFMDASWIRNALGIDGHIGDGYGDGYRNGGGCGDGYGGGGDIGGSSGYGYLDD